MRSLDWVSSVRNLLKLFWDAGEHNQNGLTQHIQWSYFVLSGIKMAC